MNPHKWDTWKQIFMFYVGLIWENRNKKDKYEIGSLEKYFLDRHEQRVIRNSRFKIWRFLPFRWSKTLYCRFSLLTCYVPTNMKKKGCSCSNVVVPRTFVQIIKGKIDGSVEKEILKNFTSVCTFKLEKIKHEHPQSYIFRYSKKKQSQWSQNLWLLKVKLDNKTEQRNKTGKKEKENHGRKSN